MKVGDFIIRKKFLDKNHLCGIVMGFDSDGDPIIFWNGGVFEEEYSSAVEVINESDRIVIDKMEVQHER